MTVSFIQVEYVTDASVYRTLLNIEGIVAIEDNHNYCEIHHKDLSEPLFVTEAYDDIVERIQQVGATVKAAR